MFPISDTNPRQRTPIVTWILIAACIAVFIHQVQLTPEAGQAFVYAYGMIPATLFGYSVLPPEVMQVSPEVSVITSMFLHGGILHLAGNMLYLWIFGDNVEDAMGPVKFLLFYVICGIVAALTQAFISPESEIPMVGASGAISGVLGAYLFMYPRAGVQIFVFLGIIIRVFTVPAMIVLSLWFALQLASGVMTPPGEPGVAFWAHIGGFVAGVVLHRLFGKPRSQVPAI